MSGLAGIMHELMDAIVGTNRESQRYSATLGSNQRDVDKLAKKFDRLKNVMGNAGDAVEDMAQAKSKQLKGEKGLFGDLLDVLHGGKIPLEIAGVATALATIPRTLNEALGPLREWTLVQSDAARAAIRGTTAVGLSSDALQHNQSTVLAASVALQSLTGLAPEAMAGLAASMVDTENIVGHHLDLTDKKTQTYVSVLAKTAKLTGLSADAAGELNKNLTVGLRLGTAAKININERILQANALGVKGAEAQKTIMEGWDTLLAIPAEDRDKAITHFLKGAALISQSGLDLRKYTEAITKSRGTEAIKQAAMMAALGHISFQEALTKQYRAAHDPAYANSAEFIGLKNSATNNFLENFGTNTNQLSKFISNAARGGPLESQQVMTARIIEEILAKNSNFSAVTGSTPEEMTAQANAADRVGKIEPKVDQGFNTSIPLAELDQMVHSNMVSGEAISKSVIDFGKDVTLFGKHLGNMFSDRNVALANKWVVALEAATKKTQPFADTVGGGAASAALGYGASALVGRWGLGALKGIWNFARGARSVAPAAEEAAAGGSQMLLPGLEAAAGSTTAAAGATEGVGGALTTVGGLGAATIATPIVLAAGVYEGLSVHSLQEQAAFKSKKTGLAQIQEELAMHEAALKHLTRASAGTRFMYDKLAKTNHWAEQHLPEGWVGEHVVSSGELKRTIALEKHAAQIDMSHPDTQKIDVKQDGHTDHSDHDLEETPAPAKPPAPATTIKKPEELVPHLKKIQELLAQLVTSAQEDNEFALHNGGTISLA